jgi:hypothetical protein
MVMKSMKMRNALRPEKFDIVMLILILAKNPGYRTQISKKTYIWALILQSAADAKPIRRLFINN